MDFSSEAGNYFEVNTKAGHRRSSLSLSSARLKTARGAITAFLVANRQTVMMTVIAVVLVMEMFEHMLINEFGENVHLYFDAIVYTLTVPTVIWFMLQLLEGSQTELIKTEQDSDQRAAFSQRLGDARTWDELVQVIAVYAQQVTRRAKATLFVYNHNNTRMEPAAACAPDGQVTLRPPMSINPDSLPIGSLPQLFLQNSRLTDGLVGSPPGPVDFPSVRQTPAPILPPHRFDLWITRNDQLIGVIKLEYPLGSSPSRAEIRTLRSLVPLIALALEGGILQNIAAEQAEASQSQRQEIAQHLHDTLAQNISYLRLKLDQLTGENAIREIGMVLDELERMRATANEAYQQVRSTLDELNPGPAQDLTTLLVNQANTICQRASFQLRTSQVGSPYNLPPAYRQQALYITREALHNVEKHARASQVSLHFLWLENGLIIKITDDGVGFNPIEASKSDNHYGLWIMQHRAQEIGGTLKIAPADSKGTEVTLWIPKPSRG